MQTRVEVNEDGQIEVRAPLETITLTRRRSEEIAAKVMAHGAETRASLQAMTDTLRMAAEAVAKMAEAFNAMPPEVREKLARELR